VPFVRSFTLQFGLLLGLRRRGLHRHPAGGARAARILDVGGDRRLRRGRGFVSLTRCDRPGVNELAEAHAGRQQRLNGNQDRRDDADHASPVAILVRSKPNSIVLSGIAHVDPVRPTGLVETTQR
jgi:hypothetical protein